MGYRWHYQDSAGTEVPGPAVEFADRTEAEDWLGLQWTELLDDGVDQVVLTEDGADVYGPMSLHPPEQ